MATDLEKVHRLHSFEEVDEFNTLGIPAAVDDTRLLLNDWLQKQQAQPQAAYIFSISVIDTGEFIGLAGINIGKPKYRIAEIWYKFDPAYWQNGYATETVRSILAFGFTDLDLHRIEAGCAVDNIASIKVLEKAGMVREGLKRKILPVRGVWVDNYFYAVLDTDVKEK